MADRRDEQHGESALHALHHSDLVHAGIGAKQIERLEDVRRFERVPIFASAWAVWHDKIFRGPFGGRDALRRGDSGGEGAGDEG